MDNNLTPEETQAGLDKIAKGDMPDSTNITKVIVDGYKDGALIAGAWYIGPEVALGKALVGGAVSSGVNSYFQWEHLNQPENANETWSYKSSAASFATGMLAPGRSVYTNFGIGMASSVFTDGANVNAQSEALVGGLAGGAFSILVPMGVNKYIGKEIPGIIYDIGSGFASGTASDVTHEYLKSKEKGK